MYDSRHSLFDGPSYNNNMDPRHQPPPVNRYPRNGANLVCALETPTIEKMKQNGVAPEWIEFAERTQHSMDPNDVRHHREFIKKHNPDDMYKEVNHFVCHPSTFYFSDTVGNPRHPAMMAQVLSTLPGPTPIVFHSPPFNVPYQMMPYVAFQNPYM